MSETELARRRCVACRPGTPTLDESRAGELHGQLDAAWRRDGTAWIRRELRFGSFAEAFAFATRVALLAEREDHHPDLEIGWGRLAVTLTTHVAGGLTENDFIVAAKVDRLAAAPRA
jgi:4a-hydroxytetrahydrobiopterin dehydratase